MRFAPGSAHPLHSCPYHLACFSRALGDRPLTTRIDIDQRVVARIHIWLVAEEQRGSSQRITAEEATERWIVGADTHPEEARLAVVAHAIAPIVAVGIRP